MSARRQPGIASRKADEMIVLQERIAALQGMDLPTLRDEWRRHYQAPTPRRLSRDLVIRGIAYKLQEHVYGGLSKATQRRLRTLAKACAKTGRVASQTGAAVAPRRTAGAAMARPHLPLSL